MSILGVKYFVSAASVNTIDNNIHLGDFVIVKDHIYLNGFYGQCPLIGPNDDEFGQRFVSLKNCYNSDLNKYFIQASPNQKSRGIVKTGIHVYFDEFTNLKNTLHVKFLFL